jgi:hypothetical protein
MNTLYKKLPEPTVPILLCQRMPPDGQRMSPYASVGKDRAQNVSLLLPRVIEWLICMSAEDRMI